MKRYWVPALAIFTLLGVLWVPAVAQEKPKLKFSFSGLFDAVTSWNQNLQDSDMTNDETEWYSRERARFWFTGQVGKAKVVWGPEFDIVNGAQVSRVHSGNSCSFRLDTDIAGGSCKSGRAGVIETKHLYLEFPFTGPGSLLPFIEMPTTARWGGQPFSGHDYKYGMHASGDFGGLRLVSTPAPTVKNTFTFVQIDEQGTSGTSIAGDAANLDSFAIINSVEFTPQKGLTVRPTFSFADYDGPARLGTPSTGGFSVTADRNLWRATIGGDVRYRSGPFSLDPTFFYQFGEQDLLPGDTTAGVGSVDIRAWILDIVGGWRSGPLKLEGKFRYSSGQEANECVQTVTGVCAGGDDINYYNAVNNGFVGGWCGWSAIWSPCGVEYNNALAPGALGVARWFGMGHDKYGLVVGGGKATYSVTPAVSVYGITTASWTANEVDTNSGISGAGLTPGDGVGDESFLGTEVIFGFTWRFAPNLKFDSAYAHLFAGDALNQCAPGGSGSAACAGVSPQDADDVDLLAARVRYTF